MSSMPTRVARRPRKRPPLRSYIPFGIFCVVCLALLAAVTSLVVHMLPGSATHPAAVRYAPHAVVAHTTGLTVAFTSTPHRLVGPTRHANVGSGPLIAGVVATHGVLASSTATLLPTATMQTSGMPPPVSTGSHLTSATTPAPRLLVVAPTASATPTGNATLVIARLVDNNGNPVQAATRFVSPARRLYAVATLRTVNASDVLRFVFERNGKVLPGDVVTYSAGGGASTRMFSAYADYQSGSALLPQGHYQLLFYRNNHLEAVSAFQVG